MQIVTLFHVRLFVEDVTFRQYVQEQNVSGEKVQFSSVQDGMYALRKTHKRSTPSLRHFLNVAFETVLMFVCLTMALSRPFKEDRLALPLSAPLSSRRSMV